MKSSRVVGYVLPIFPQLSETFIANEILLLERLGVPIRVYSCSKPTAVVPHRCVRLIQAPVHYVPESPAESLQLLHANRTIYRLEPSRYRRTARYVLARSFREGTDTWRRFLQAAYIASEIRRDGVRHLHACFASMAAQVAMLANMLTGVPYSFSGHAKDIYTTSGSDLRDKIRRAEFVVTCTRANQKHLQDLVDSGERHKISLSYHGVDVAKFHPREQVRSTEHPLILSVGRLVEKKGFADLLRACAVLRGKGYPIRCFIVGEGPERSLLERMARSLGLKNVVTLPGACSQEELLEIYRQATVFVLPCRTLRNGDRDGIPNVLLEAMAVGLPVVSSAISGIPELIQSGQNGLLVKECDGDALLSAVELLLQNAELRERLAENARTTVVRNFDSRTTVGRLASCFNGLGRWDAGALQEPLGPRSMNLRT